MVPKLKKEISDRYLEILKNKGEDGLYRHIIGTGVMRSVRVPNPEVEILDMSDSFFSLFRSTGIDDYFIIGKILRRAAHKLYRQFLRINKEKPRSGRFLNVVS